MANVQPKQQYAFWLTVGVLLIAGILLRILHLEHYPLAVNQDELSNIYDGYSIAETGADRWGQKYPMILKAFGLADYRPPMYAWLSSVTISFFGFSIASGRLVSALLGSASLGLLFVVAKRIGGKIFALFALLLAVLSPWHILFSRIGSEGTILPSFFLISACYLWQNARSKNYALGQLALLGLCVGLGTNTYQAGKLIFFIFALVVLVDLWTSGARRLPQLMVFGACCLVGASPQIIVMLTMSSHFFSRASMSSVPFSFSINYFSTIIKNIASNISPDFLFLTSKEYNNLTVARLLIVEIGFFYLGLLLIYKVINKNQVIKPGYFYLLLFAAIIPSALTIENPHALRSSGLIVLLPLVTAAGIKIVLDYISKEYLKTIFLATLFCTISYNGLVCITTYMESEDLRNQGMQALLVKSSQRLNEMQEQYEKVYVEITGNQQYIYLLAYCNIKPQDFQAADIEMNYGDWDDFKRIGKYHFINRSEVEDRAKDDKVNSLVLLRVRNNTYQALDSVENMNEKMYFYKRQATPATPVALGNAR